jgi:hypothetical protein
LPKKERKKKKKKRMSGEGPESIPTSADPRSKRPTKKRALTPVSEQAKNVDALFAKPDQEIRVPTGGPPKPRIAAPPEIVTNVQGSSAGAGSGEFHVYKASRRREYERLRVMDEAVQKEKADEDFEKSRTERSAQDDEKTRKNREKREKAKARKAKKGSGATPAGNKNGAANGGSSARVRDTDLPSAGIDSLQPGGGNGQEATSSTPGIVIHDDD